MEKTKELAKRYGLSGVNIALLTFLVSYVDSKTEALERDIASKKEIITQYVDIKHNNVKGDLSEIKRILVKIEDRVYKLTEGR